MSFKAHVCLLPYTSHLAATVFIPNSGAN